MRALALMSRWSLAVLYLLATWVIQCVHDHGPCPEFEADGSHRTSVESGPLLSCHTSADEASAPHDCAACQFQAEHQADAFPAPLPLAIPHASAGGSPSVPWV